MLQTGKGLTAMVREFRIGDMVRRKNGAPNEAPGVIIQCQPACVYRVQMSDGTIYHYSGQQLARIGVGNERTSDNPAALTEKRKEVCN